jgi:fluoride exporter
VEFLGLQASEDVGMEYLWVWVGGAFGALARYIVGLWIVERLGTGFPYHTLAINLSGSFAIGVLLTLLTERLLLDPAWRLLLVVGFLGGYTTFSSYTFEAFALAEAGEWLRASLYVLGSNGLGLASVTLGTLLARALSRA